MIGFFPLLLESAPNPIPLIALGVFLVFSLFHSVLLYQLQLHTTDLPPSLPPKLLIVYLPYSSPYLSNPPLRKTPDPYP